MNTFAKTMADATYRSRQSALVNFLKSQAIRSVEIVIALSVLLLSGPIMVLMWLAIKIDSPGPAIFKQIRMGKNYPNGGNPLAENGPDTWRCRRKQDLGYRPFTFYKFRTMYVDAAQRFPDLYRYNYTPDEINKMRFKLEDDPRLTRFGRYLRKTTLDELPNFINLLKGDIALVGPRPDIPEMIRYYNGSQKKKLAVKPGITGLAQVNGRGILTFQETLELDIAYVENKSFWLDLKIIFKTISVSFRRVGAF